MRRERRRRMRPCSAYRQQDLLQPLIPRKARSLVESRAIRKTIEQELRDGIHTHHRLMALNVEDPFKWNSIPRRTPLPPTTTIVRWRYDCTEQGTIIFPVSWALHRDKKNNGRTLLLRLRTMWIMMVVVLVTDWLSWLRMGQIDCLLMEFRISCVDEILCPIYLRRFTANPL